MGEWGLHFIMCIMARINIKELSDSLSLLYTWEDNGLFGPKETQRIKESLRIFENDVQVFLRKHQSVNPPLRVGETSVKNAAFHP
jgi:hypothetical protein